MANLPKTQTKEYWLLESLKRRCKDYGDGKNHQYHGKGIKVCKRWSGRDGYENFVSDMGRRPSDKHQIDRIDNDKGYSPENCRWVTKSQQMMNKGPSKDKKYKGVFFRSDGYRKKRWTAKIAFNKKRIELGTYLTEKEAAIAYNKAALKYHGKYACLNEVI
jgi:hypothetical protein